MNYINIFKNAQALSISMGYSSSENHFIHMFLDNFHQGVKYYVQIVSHLIELRKEEKHTDQNCLSISSLQTDYLNLNNSSGSNRNNER